MGRDACIVRGQCSCVFELFEQDYRQIGLSGRGFVADVRALRIANRGTTMSPKIRLCGVCLVLSLAALGVWLIRDHWKLARESMLWGPRRTLDFNPDWKFIKGDVSGAAEPAFDDSSWSTVSTPHTYNDTDTFDDWSIPGHRGERNQWSGRTWYRKTFALPVNCAGKTVVIEFEAVRQVAEVYLNGTLLGTAKSGFIPFAFDLTSHLKTDGTPNVLAVMCDNRFMTDPIDPEYLAKITASPVGGSPLPDQNMLRRAIEVNRAIPEALADLQADQIPWNNPRWHPAHGGIYRNVRLHVLDPLHITLPLFSFLRTAGPYAYATEVTPTAATVHLEVPIHNGRSVRQSVELFAEVFAADGRSVLTLNQECRLESGADETIQLCGVLPQPLLWAPASPHLYRIVCTLRLRGRTIDTCEIPFGVRTARWDRATGLALNGEPLKLHGWGQRPTDEWPGLGAAMPDWMHFYTLQLMREAGGNFIRWGHCAGGPASISAGDRLGLICDQPGLDGSFDTFGSAWQLRSDAFRDTIIYYRNNPSILLWEAGNWKICRDHALELRAIADRLDPHGGRAFTFRRAVANLTDLMDVELGTEGGRDFDQLPVVEAEYDREESPRRIWDQSTPPNWGYREARGQPYRLTSEEYAVNQITNYVQKLGATTHGGGANWIFSDTTSGGRVGVEVARASGEVDGMRLPKEAYYACQAMFADGPQLHIIGHWTYPPGTKKTVYVVSNGEQVELFVNGQSLGLGKVTNRHLFEFPDVAFGKGEIRAVARIGGQDIATRTKRTSSGPFMLRLTPILGPGGLHADGSDVALIDVEVTDFQGERYPLSQDRVEFEVEGAGVWRGGYNSGKSHSTNNLFLELEAGINRVAIRSTRAAGEIRIRARAVHRQPAQLILDSQPSPTTNGYAEHLPVPAEWIVRGALGCPDPTVTPPLPPLHQPQRKPRLPSVPPPAPHPSPCLDQG